MIKKIFTTLLVLMLLLSLTACKINITRDGRNLVDRKPDQSVEFNEDITDAKSLKLTYDIGIAEFWLEGTEEPVISTVANYDYEDLMPKFSLTGDEDLQFKIVQKDIDFNLSFNPDPDCIINNKVNSSIPVDIDFDLGVGESFLNLTDINVGELKVNAGTGRLSTVMAGTYQQEIDTDIDGGVGELDLEFTGTFNEQFKLDVDSGVGSVDLDLTGSFTKDGYITAKGGVGEIKMKLPSDVGIKIEGEKGLSSFTIRDGGKKINSDLNDIEYTNDLYGVSDVTLFINVETGIGSVDITID